ncbi:MAG: helix-turn-helix transcriptional regulator [Clostridia bacterium]|nr:helix-turn-helix transcriptional regulator [Clostridia bacterium]
MTYIKAIGLRLKELLNQKKLTQTQFATESKISRTTINGTIKGKVNIVTFECLLLICETLNITIKVFFNSNIFEEKFEVPEKKKGRRIQHR